MQECRARVSGRGDRGAMVGLPHLFVITTQDACVSTLALYTRRQSPLEGELMTGASVVVLLRLPRLRGRS
jgi:hypothetical protein